MKHFYILYESAQTGYILDKAKSNLYLKEMENQFHKISNFIAEQFYLGKSEQYVLDKLKPISKYPISTHKAVINLEEHKQSKSMIRLTVAPGRNDNVYFIATHDEIKDFTNVSRFEPSVDCFFSSIIKDEEGDDAVMQLYLN